MTQPTVMSRCIVCDVEQWPREKGAAAEAFCVGFLMCRRLANARADVPKWLDQYVCSEHRRMLLELDAQGKAMHDRLRDEAKS